MTVALTIAIGLKAAPGCAYSTDNGATFQTFGATSAVVPARQPSTAVLAGFADGTLQSATATLYAFPAAVSAIFVNPANEDRITVGLQSGDVWRSLDGGSTWFFMASFGHRISQMVEAADGLTTYVVSDTTIWVSRRAFQDAPTDWIKFIAPVRAVSMVLGAWGNYAGASDGTVVNVDTLAVLAGPTSSVGGLAYNPRHGTLWVAEMNGTFWRMRQGDSALSSLSSIPAGGGRLSPITPIPGAILSANEGGAWLSPDAGVTWRKLRAGPAASIGYYSPPVPGGY